MCGKPGKAERHCLPRRTSLLWVLGEEKQHLFLHLSERIQSQLESGEEGGRLSKTRSGKTAPASAQRCCDCQRGECLLYLSPEARYPSHGGGGPAIERVREELL